MEPKFQTSFIPKRALEEAATGHPRRGTVGIVTVISLIIFLGSILAALGVFLYSRVVVQQIASKNSELERARGEFEPALIEALAQLDRRLGVSGELLKGHVALSPLFQLLGSLTLKSVRFESFKYGNDGPDKIIISLRGVAKSFGSVALQSDVFGKSPFIKNPIFANPNLDQDGNVVFDFTATLDSRLLSYSEALVRKP